MEGMERKLREREAGYKSMKKKYEEKYNEC